MFIPTKLYKINCDVEPDEYDKGMVDTILKIWNSHFNHSPDLPRVGDYVIMPNGKYERASYVWDDAIQTSESGQFSIGVSGASFSGGLNPGILKEKFVNTGETKEGTFWTFHHDDWCASNGIGIRCSCRVFKVI